MIRPRYLRHGLVAAIAVAVPASLLPGSQAAADPEQPAVKVIADGLYNPRGIALGESGKIYVAEAGAGGTKRVTISSPEGGGASYQCFGETGAITRIEAGEQERVVDDLPSLAGPGPNGSCNPSAAEATTGPHDVAVPKHEKLLIAVGLGAAPAARDAAAERVRSVRSLGTLRKAWSELPDWTLADLAAYEHRRNPDNAERDSNPYSVAALSKGGSLVVDAGGNSLLKVNRRGTIRTVAVFPGTPRAMPTLSCTPPAGAGLPPAGTPIPSQAVPTSVVVGPDGAYYVGELTGFPFTPETASVYRVDPKTRAVTTYASGFTNVVDIAFGPDRSLYVLEITRDGLLETEFCQRPPLGRLWKVENGQKQEIPVPGLLAPGGVAVAETGTIYLTNNSVMPGGAGEVLRVRLGD
jgi:streptogramin lyase